MNKFNLIFCTLAAMITFACVSKQIGLKENWIDERDVIALTSSSVSDWLVKAGLPTLVEINGDTSIYYYNYRPTMYAATVYDSTTLFATWGTAKEVKPGLENLTEVWGSRKNVMQIKVVNNVAISAVITEGPDKKILIRDLNGDLVLDPTSGYSSNISEEQKISNGSEQFKVAYSKLQNKVADPITGTNMNPWEYYRYKQQLEAYEKANAAAAAESEIPIAASEIPVAAEPEMPVAIEPVAEPVAAEPEAVPVATEPASHPQAIGQ